MIVEVILLVIGMILLILSFVLPDNKNSNSEENKKVAEAQIHDLVNKEMGQIQGQVQDAVSEAMDYAMEKTEKALEKISNEKIMAVSDYSETVLEDIHKNHEEAMFLYDVLNAKHTNLKEAADEVDQKVKEAEEASNVAMQATREAQAATQVASSVAPVFKFLEDIPKVDSEENVVGKPETKERVAMNFDLKALERVAPAPTPVSSEPVEEMNPVTNEDDTQNEYKKIRELAEMGLSANEIAKELGKGVGEVELILRFY